MQFQNDLYSILGVSRTATPQEIRKAYVARARVVHPDRFDQDTQTKDWLYATQMLAELNGAYETLSDPERRREYDVTWQKQPQATNPPHESPTATNSEDGDDPIPLKNGTINFSELSPFAKVALLNRQRRKLPDEFRVATASYATNFVLAAMAVTWFSFLMYRCQGGKWSNFDLFWLGGGSIVAGLVLGKNTITLFRLATSNLGDYFYITPLYFVETKFDVIRFRAIWDLEDIVVTHQHRDGEYESTLLVLKFSEGPLSLTLWSRNEVDDFFKKLSLLDKRGKNQFESGRLEYFTRYDFFSTSNIQHTTRRATQNPRYNTTFVQYIAATCGFAIFVIAFLWNRTSATQTWVRHSANPPASVEIVGAARPIASGPGDQSPPQARLPRKLIRPAESARPSRTFVPAQSPHVTREEFPQFSIPEQPLPFNGTLNRFDNREAIAPFAIITTAGSNYLVKLVNVDTGTTCLTVFVQGGMTTELKVPLGKYEVRYASGHRWYGCTYLFGPETSYNKADEHFHFLIDGNRVEGYSITLYRVPNGNLHTSSINPDQF